MATDRTAWRVAAGNKPLTRLEDNLWIVTGPVPGLKMPLRRKMTVMRLADGKLVLHSAIALEETELEKLLTLGPIGYIIVPSRFHRIDGPKYKARFPEAQLLCPSASQKHIAPLMPVDGNYDAFPDDSNVRVETLEGGKLGEGVFIVTSGPNRDRVTLVFNDAVFNLKRVPGFGGTIYHWIGSSGGPRVTPLFKFGGVKDKQKFAAHLARLAETPHLVRVIPAHGTIMDTDAAATLKIIASTV